MLTDGLKQSGGFLEVLDPASNGLFKILGDVLHGGFAGQSLSEVERAVLAVVVGGASAARISAATGHLDDGAVE